MPFCTCVKVLLMVSGVGEASTVSTEIDRFDTTAGWCVNADGGHGIRFCSDSADPHTKPAAMRVSFSGTQWGNLRRAITVPRDATALVAWVRRHQASPEAVMHVWLLEPDGDGYITRVQIGGKEVSDWPEGWQFVRLPLGRFQYDPRGDRKSNLLAVDRMLLGFNFGSMEISVDDLAWERRREPAASTMPASREFRVVEGAKGRIALLDEPDLCAAHERQTAVWLAGCLKARGYGVTALRAGDAADAGRLCRANFDLLIMTQGERFPAEAVDNIRRYLQAGGSLWTLGGYAFDQPMTFAGDAWQPLGSFETAEEIQAGRVKTFRVNTRLGKPGDAMHLEPQQMGMFDPSYRFEQVAWAEIGGKRLSGVLEGFPACITDPTGSPVSAKAHLRLLPLGQTYDRLGRRRGALGGLAHHFSGAYGGSSWAFFGVTNRAIFADGGIAADEVGGLAARLVDQVYLHNLTTDLACYRQRETVRIGVTVANRGRFNRRGIVRVWVDDRMIHEQALDAAPGGGQGCRVETSWKPGGFERDFYRVRAVLTLPDRTDEVETAFCVWNEDVIRKGRKIDLRENYFTVDGRAAYLTGCNQTGRMWLSEYENPLVWRGDFAGMRDHGLILWRVLHFSAVMGHSDPMSLARDIPEKVLRQTDAIVQLAQKYGVVLFLTLHDWMPLELTGEQLAAQAKWNRFWANRYRDVPGILYDIQNEPGVGIPDAPHIRAEWERFLAARHGGSEKAKARLGAASTNPALPWNGPGGWFDLKAVDAEWFRAHLVNRWVKANADAVRAADPGSLVTVGYLQGMRCVDKVLGAEFLDFSNMHSYTSLREFPGDFKIIDRRAVGKTLSLGEFGAKESHDARVSGQFGDASMDAIRRFMVTNHYVMGLGGSFTASWCWRDMPDCVFPWGLVRSDELPKPVARAYRNFTLMSRFITPVYVPPAQWVVLPDAHRLGGRWDDVQAAVGGLLDTLIGLNAEFGVFSEADVASGILEGFPARQGGRMPSLIWPIPYCPDDTTFAAVKKAVEAGAVLYLSGDVSYDDRRQPTKANRLSALGLKLDAHKPPFEPTTEGPLECSQVAKGRVFFVPYPVEVSGRASGRLRQTVAEFLTQAGIPRAVREPDDADVHAFTVRGDTGVVAYSLINHSGARHVSLTAAGQPFVMSVGKGGWGMVGLDSQGGLTLFQTQGDLSRGDRLICRTRSDTIVAALDRKDITASASLLVVPGGAGAVDVETKFDWKAPVATVGDVIDGEFKVIETLKASVSGGRLQLSFDPDHALSLVLVTESADAGAAAREVLGLLMLRSP